MWSRTVTGCTQRQFREGGVERLGAIQPAPLQVATPELAAVRIQAAARGWLARKHVVRSTADEDIFLGSDATVRSP